MGAEATFERVHFPARGREGGGPGAAGRLSLASGTVLKGKGFQLIPPGKTIPDRSVVMGVPGKIVREISQRDLAMIEETSAHYRARGRLYRRTLAIDERSAERVNQPVQIVQGRG